MKKIICILIINIFLTGLVIFCSEYMIYKSAVKEYISRSEASKYIPYPKFFQSYRSAFYTQTAQYNPDKEPLWIRGIAMPEDGITDGKRPILIFGCSFAHGGYFLKNNQTFGYKLAQATKRKIYNFAMCGCGIQHMFMLIQKYTDSNITKEDKPEYAIYLYIPNHIQRLRANIFPGLLYNGTVLHYNISNGYPVQEKTFPPLLSKMFTVKKILYLSDVKRESRVIQNRYDNFALANELFLASRDALRKKYPGIKFIILRYEIEDDDNYREAPFMWDVLKSEGFTVINSSDLIGRKFKYRSEDTAGDYYHPSEAAWDMLIPELIKELDL